MSAGLAQLLELFAAYDAATADGCEDRRHRCSSLAAAAAASGLQGRAVLPLLREASLALRGRIACSNPSCLGVPLRRSGAAAGQLGDAVAFASFYRFAFFVSREAGQRNLSVETALALWPLLLTGRFRLLDRWCAFVAATRRLGITEDTWRQVLDFSRLVHEDLSNYDPQGAWPVLVDEFVDALCGRNGGGAHPRGLRRRVPAGADDGYSADGELDDGGGGPGAAGAAHLLSRPPVAGSKRRVPSASSLQDAAVDCIAERLARIQASPPKRQRADLPCAFALPPRPGWQQPAIEPEAEMHC